MYIYANRKRGLRMLKKATTQINNYLFVWGLYNFTYPTTQLMIYMPT